MGVIGSYKNLQGDNRDKESWYTNRVDNINGVDNVNRVDNINGVDI